MGRRVLAGRRSGHPNHRKDGAFLDWMGWKGIKQDSRLYPVSRHSNKHPMRSPRMYRVLLLEAATAYSQHSRSASASVCPSNPAQNTTCDTTCLTFSVDLYFFSDCKYFKYEYSTGCVLNASNMGHDIHFCCFKCGMSGRTALETVKDEPSDGYHLVLICIHSNIHVDHGYKRYCRLTTGTASSPQSRACRGSTHRVPSGNLDTTGCRISTFTHLKDWVMIIPHRLSPRLAGRTPARFIVEKTCVRHTSAMHPFGTETNPG